MRKILSLIILFTATSLLQASELTLQKGDNICLVGNALGERMQHQNWWETLLYQQFPDQELRVRNLCFPGDEPFLRLRSENFGDPDVHLTHSKASVILFFFGYNESFEGPEGVEHFSAEIKRLVEHTQMQDYSGKGAPRMVFVSPIAFENLHDPNKRSGEEINKNLALYTDALEQAAKESGVGFVDVFHPTLELFGASEQQLSLNGIHLNEDGYQALAPVLMTALFEIPQVSEFDPELKATIDDKNFHWWHRYRAVNGYSIYGTRGQAGSDGTYNNEDVMERERTILDQMTANRDELIWAIAQGKPVPEDVDDSDTLPFFQPKTNVGGPDDPNARAGKLGSLDYLTAEDQLELFQLPPGYEINLVASEEQFPELANPVALNFDNKGRLWVSTMASYPHWKPKTKLDDKLLIFEDHDKDGRADKCIVFAGGLHQPTGFEIGNDGAYVAQQPDVLFLKDTDGDDQADTRVRQLIGFDSADSHHGLAAFTWGQDGGLYFQEGTFKYSQIESPYGLTRLQEAGVWRYDPRTEKFRVHASFSFANPWGHVFDGWGQDFIADASPGLSYWAAPITGYIKFPMKHPGGSHHKRIAVDSGGDPQYRFPTFYQKRIRPSAGCELVSSRNFPPEAQGNFLLTNCIGDRAVLNHTVRESGSGFIGEEVQPLVSGGDGNFRPVDVQFGPDGALYIVDWHNALIGHLQHNLRDPSRDHSHGRIWRVIYKDRPLVDPPQIADAPIPQVLKALEEPEDRTRYRARRELAQRDTDEVVQELESWVASLQVSSTPKEHALLEALWVSQTHNVINESLLERVLNSSDHRARAAATRVVSFWHDQLPNTMDLLRRAVDDPHPRVRLEAVRACSFVHTEESMEVALNVLNQEMDEYLQYTLDETIRALEVEVVGLTHEMDHHLPTHGDFRMDHDHMHDGSMKTMVKKESPKPLIFFDKGPEILEYQLRRLPVSQLLLVEQSVDEKNAEPIYRAIVSRDRVSRQDREEAVKQLSDLSGNTVSEVIFESVSDLNWELTEQRRTIRQLAQVLLSQPKANLKEQADFLKQQAESDIEAARILGLATLIALEDSKSAWEIAQRSTDLRLEFLASIPLVPRRQDRAAVREYVVNCLENTKVEDVQLSAIEALAYLPGQQEETFLLVSPFMRNGKLRAAATQTLLQIPKDQRPAGPSESLVKYLVDLAERLPARRRTSEDFLDAMHLADELMATLSAEEAQGYRDRLREVVVRVVRINTVEEEMRYDTPHFAVEAGRPVQVVLRNEDLMPHNLVITTPDNLREVAQLAAKMTAAVDKNGLQYVPESELVLHATKMVASHSQDVITFNAPKEPGEYPYVCTFPNHWMRMYGVMVVVEDLEAYQANPTEPKDPLGITRSLVKNWTMEDFEGNLAARLEGRQPFLGERLFKEATCLQCHKFNNEGGAVGPDLTETYERHKGDDTAVLREILDPSYKVEEKYALYNILTVEGLVISGIIQGQDAETVTIISNPEKPEPQVIMREDIEEMFKSSSSMMPKGLMDRFTDEEILELLTYLKSGMKN
ncbi:Outer membrane protein H.8 [Planctomycetales bacterium 10988]|nr:Outer membrane protein H.8 [Planctomycetales bacterium 10988]